MQKLVLFLLIILYLQSVNSYIKYEIETRKVQNLKRQYYGWSYRVSTFKQTFDSAPSPKGYCYKDKPKLPFKNSETCGASTNIGMKFNFSFYEPYGATYQIWFGLPFTQGYECYVNNYAVARTYSSVRWWNSWKSYNVQYLTYYFQKGYHNIQMYGIQGYGNDAFNLYYSRNSKGTFWFKLSNLCKSIPGNTCPSQLKKEKEKKRQQQEQQRKQKEEQLKKQKEEQLKKEKQQNQQDDTEETEETQDSQENQTNNTETSDELNTEQQQNTEQTEQTNNENEDDENGENSDEDQSEQEKENSNEQQEESPSIQEDQTEQEQNTDQQSYEQDDDNNEQTDEQISSSDSEQQYDDPNYTCKFTYTCDEYEDLINSQCGGKGKSQDEYIECAVDILEQQIEDCTEEDKQYGYDENQQEE